MKAAIGQLASDVSSACICSFDAISVSQSVLRAISLSCPEHGLAAVKAYHLEKTDEVIDDETAREILERDTPEEYD